MFSKPKRYSPLFLLLGFLISTTFSLSSLYAQQITEKDLNEIAKERYPELFMPKDEFETTAEYNERVKRQKQIVIEMKNELIEELEKKQTKLKRLAKEKAAEEERENKRKIIESITEVNFHPHSISMYNADFEIFTISYTETIIKNRKGYVFRHHLKDFGGNVYIPALPSIPVYSLPSSPTQSIGSKVIDRIYSGEKIKVTGKKGDFYSFSDLVDKVAVQLKVPRAEARSLKENFTSSKMEGYQKLKANLMGYELINMALIHPITGSRYPFGEQIDLVTLKESAEEIPTLTTLVPPDLTMRVAFVEPNGNGFLDAEEKGRVKVSVTNNGKGPAMGLILSLEDQSKNNGLSFLSSRVIGEILPGATKSGELEITASKDVTRSVNSFLVSAKESYGFPPDPMKISFETFPFIPPKLELVDFGVSTPNEGNEIRPQTTTEVQARVQNRGQGPAEDVQFSINLPKGVYFTPDSRQKYTFSVLKPGEFKDLEFAFNTAKTVGETIDVSIGFAEESTTGKFPLDLEVAKPQRTIQQLVVKGQEIGTVEFADVATVSVDIEKNIPKTKRKGRNDLAVVFGIESYKNVPGVSFAKRDATWMQKYFEAVLGIPKNRIYYKTDSDVSLAVLNVAFGGWLEKRLKKDSNVFIYYAGHGAPDIKANKAYLIPYDGNPNYASDTGYEMDALYKQLGNLGAASVTVFLDACFSGANRNNEMLLADARPVFMEVQAGIPGNVTVFSAAGGKEISSAWPEKKHGLFSYFLMKGMRGDADVNGDREITMGELGDYIKENVSEMAGMLDREQTPGLQTMNRGKVLVKY